MKKKETKGVLPDLEKARDEKCFPVARAIMKVKLLDLFNKGIQVHCKIVDVKKEDKIIPTNEEIDVTIFDPAHGLISTGEKIDGFVTHTDLQYKIHIPGVQDEVWVDAEFLN